MVMTRRKRHYRIGHRPFVIGGTLNEQTQQFFTADVASWLSIAIFLAQQTDPTTRLPLKLVSCA